MAKKKRVTTTSRSERSPSVMVAQPKPARSWAEFLEQIRAAREDLGKPDTVWYRGHSRANYKLTPSLLRNPQWLQKEKVLFHEYERSANQILDEQSSDWNLLINMQHYGIPTRLLDWTDILGVALAFALYDSLDDDEDSVVYVLDPIKLNSESGLREIKRVPNDRKFDYKACYWEGRPFKPAYPIAIDTPFKNNRIAAQKGSFTIHGANHAAIEDQAPASTRRILIPSAIKPAAREFLDYADLNPFSIYPDIVGMAQHIVRKHLK